MKDEVEVELPTPLPPTVRRTTPSPPSPRAPALDAHARVAPARRAVALALEEPLRYPTSPLPPSTYRPHALFTSDQRTH